MVRAIRLALEGVDIKLEQGRKNTGGQALARFLYYHVTLDLYRDLLLVRCWHSLIQLGGFDATIHCF